MTTEYAGILNLTPESIDGGHRETPVEHAKHLFELGATIVDIGAQATNPWATALSAQQELAILKPFLPQLLELEDYPRRRFSIDTFRSEVAEFALRMGRFIVNDVMTFRDPKVREVAARYNAECIVNHSPLAAQTIVEVHDMQIDSRQQVEDELNEQVELLVAAGVPRRNIIVDPGVGFGKTMGLNWILIEFARFYTKHPVMIGPSFKRVVATLYPTGEVVPGANKKDPKLNAEVVRLANRAGARYVRVHEAVLRELTS
jgi:dihydropteroate synthase